MRNPLLVLGQLPRIALRSLLYPLSIPKRSAVALITLYRQTFSPDHGLLRSLFPYGYCRHSPTCSEYGIRVIGRWGVTIGGILLFRRILSCHPWARVSDERLRQAIDIDAKRATIQPCNHSLSLPTPAQTGLPIGSQARTHPPGAPQDTTQRS